MDVKTYKLKARYYETDKMGIIHHSNYIRWFEEARVDALEQMGLSYDKLEAMGIASPVLSVNCQYLHPVHFNDELEISLKFTNFTGARFEVIYEIKNITTGDICTKGSTTHGFIGENGRPIRLKKQFPEVFYVLNKYFS